MTRVVELKSPDQVPDAARAAYDEIVASRGSIRGPFGVLLHSPELARRAGSLGGFLRYESSLEPKVRETAVMATAAVLECDYEWAAHLPQALEVGVPAEVIEAIRLRRPADLGDDERDLYLLAEAVLAKHRVPAELFERLHKRLGLQGLVEVVAAVGYWSFVAATLNTFEVLPAAG
ncbi:MAG TPA: carboxymuconolactone decarboxylase family protein [Chloroflexota bacterium]|nr:carboxymuconolactone decarboxylase family protein [Chloroflexota bacterium]